MQKEQMTQLTELTAKYVADCKKIGVTVDNVDFSVVVSVEAVQATKEDIENFNIGQWIEHGEPMKMAELEKKMIIRALKKTGNVKGAAAELQISERSLWRKMKIYGLTPDGERRK